MGEPLDAAAYRALMAGQDWATLLAQLNLHGVKRKRLSDDLAEQIAANTLTRVLDPARSPWKPDEHGPLLNHLEWAFKSELANYRKKNTRVRATSEEDIPEPPPDSDGDPDVRAERQGNLAVLREKLFAALAKRPLALKLLALEEEEQVSEVSEQVARTGAMRAQVYEARRILAETARALLAEGGHHLSRERSAVKGGKDEESP